MHRKVIDAKYCPAATVYDGGQAICRHVAELTMPVSSAYGYATVRDDKPIVTDPTLSTIWLAVARQKGI